jgi:hypothetical protein
MLCAEFYYTDKRVASVWFHTFMAKPFLCLSKRNQILARKVVDNMRIRYQPDGDMTCSAESFVLTICNSVYPPLISIRLYHNQLQNILIKRLSIGRDRNLNLALHERSTTLDDAYFSWMLDSKLQRPKPAGSNMPHNG